MREAEANEIELNRRMALKQNILNSNNLNQAPLPTGCVKSPKRIKLTKNSPTPPNPFKVNSVTVLSEMESSQTIQLLTDINSESIPLKNASSPQNQLVGHPNLTHSCRPMNYRQSHHQHVDILSSEQFSPSDWATFKANLLNETLIFWQPVTFDDKSRTVSNQSQLDSPIRGIVIALESEPNRVYQLELSNSNHSSIDDFNRCPPNPMYQQIWTTFWSKKNENAQRNK